MAAVADLELCAQEGSALLAVEGEASINESSALIFAATAEGSTRRRLCRVGGFALAIISLVAATSAAVALTGYARPPARSSSGQTEAVQGKQIVALAGCPMLGPLPELWSPVAGAPPLQLKVLTYNLFWWKLFDKGQFAQPNFHLRTQGNTGTQLLARAASEEHFDVMGFQECNDEGWLLAKAGLAEKYDIFRDKHSCMAYGRASWSLLGRGVEWVALDAQYGPRPAQWMRLRHKATGRILFFVNHHGPIPINSGGKCGGAAVAQNILHMVQTKAVPGDAVVLTGDFNSDSSSATIQRLQARLRSAFSGTKFGGVDYIFSNLEEGSLVSSKNWGGGGSDHDALSAVLRVSGIQAATRGEQQHVALSTTFSVQPSTMAPPAAEFASAATSSGESDSFSAMPAAGGSDVASRLRFLIGAPMAWLRK